VPRDADKKGVIEAFDDVVLPFERISHLFLTPHRYQIMHVLPMYPSLHKIDLNSNTCHSMVLCHRSGLRGNWATPPTSTSATSAEGKTRSTIKMERDFYKKFQDAEVSQAKSKRNAKAYKTAILSCSSFGYHYVNYKSGEAAAQDAKAKAKTKEARKLARVKAKQEAKARASPTKPPPPVPRRASSGGNGAGAGSGSAGSAGSAAGDDDEESQNDEASAAEEPESSDSDSDE
jgi:hypothetical protein